MSEEEKSFVIKDRRRFSAEGEAQEEAAPKTDSKAADQPEKKAEQKEREAAKTERPRSMGPLPEVHFSTFVLSLTSSAMLHLGELPDPSTNTKSVDLSLAKHTIDILGMLQDKTKGNLKDDEKQLLDHVLTELRLKYVSLTKK